MKLTIGKLRRIIREVMDQEAVVPGRYTGDGEYSEEDPERLGYGGFLGLDEMDDEDPKTQG